MGACGKYVKNFKDANLATCTGISLDAGYGHYFFDIVSIERNKVNLKSHYDGSLFSLNIRRGKYGQFCWIELTDYLFKIKKRFKICPFAGERI